MADLTAGIGVVPTAKLAWSAPASMVTFDALEAGLTAVSATVRLFGVLAANVIVPVTVCPPTTETGLNESDLIVWDGASADVEAKESPRSNLVIGAAVLRGFRMFESLKRGV